ncbi:MAG: hypothetical protein AAF266_02045 [Planctomycetota bacterium]
MRTSHLRVTARAVHSLLRAGIPLVLFAVAATALAADCVRPGDRLLLISTRPVGCTTDAPRLAEGIHAAEYADGGWQTTPFDATVGSIDPTLPVIFYIHGNQIDSCEAPSRGRDVYRRLVRCAADDRPIQFVVFSWASGKVKGLLRDYREKAARTRPVAWQLAWVLDRLPAGSQVGLIGYSYGARVSSGAAHLLAGGSLSGLRYDGCTTCGVTSMRAVFMAAAYDACWNSRRGYHRHTLDKIDTLLATVNPRDPAMKYYKWVPSYGDPPALGGVGPKGLDAEQASRVRLKHVAGSVGRSHDLYDYLSTPGLMTSAWRRLTFSDAAPTPQLAAEPASDTVAQR